MDKIIDFHVHPLLYPDQQITMYNICSLTPQSFKSYLVENGITNVCGSVISPRHTELGLSEWENVKRNNDSAYQLKAIYGDFYIPGIHVHPAYVDESVAELDRACGIGVILVGELVPYVDHWEDHYHDIHSILDYIETKNMIVSIHALDDPHIDELVCAHPKVTFVGAHPGHWTSLFAQIERMKRYDNYYLDISAEGITRFGMLQQLKNEVGTDRLLYGSDFPSCNPCVFIAGVRNDPFITQDEKEAILFKNAQRLLNAHGGKL